MMPRNREKNAWCLLSLDYIQPLFRDLWIPVQERSSFQAQLKEQLEPWLSEPKYQQEGEALSYAIADWYRYAHGPAALDLLFLWMREIYQFHGPDRIGETVWNIVPYRANDIAAEFPGSQWVFDLLAKVKDEQEEKTAAFDERMPIGAPVSSWDSRVLEVQYASQEGLETKIGLIATYNIFLQAWEKQCSQLSFEELRYVFKVGTRVAETNQMQDLDVVFPGSWRFELRKLLDVFA